LGDPAYRGPPEKGGGGGGGGGTGWGKGGTGGGPQERGLVSTGGGVWRGGPYFSGGVGRSRRDFRANPSHRLVAQPPGARGFRWASAAEGQPEGSARGANKCCEGKGRGLETVFGRGAPRLPPGGGTDGRSWAGELGPRHAPYGNRGRGWGPVYFQCFGGTRPECGALFFSGSRGQAEVFRDRGVMGSAAARARLRARGARGRGSGGGGVLGKQRVGPGGVRTSPHPPVVPGDGPGDFRAVPAGLPGGQEKPGR